MCFTACADNSGSYVDVPELQIIGGKQPYYIEPSVIENTDFSRQISFDTVNFENDEKISALMNHLFADNNDSALYGADFCYVSKLPVRRFDVEKHTETPALMYFVFTDEMFPAGEVFLSENNGSFQCSGSYFSTSMYSGFILPCFLKNNPDSTYILLKDSQSTVLLDEHNKIVFGTDKDNFSVSGDVFGKLQKNGFGISYAELTLPENCIRYNFVKI